MIDKVQWLVDAVVQGFFPDARTPLQRREILVSIAVVVVLGLMWAAAAESGRLSDAPPFGSK